MAIDRSELSHVPRSTAVLSGRARSALEQHQRRVATLQRELHGADRMLSGALTACDGASQYEMLGAYLEAVQELRVSLQRLEGFLMQRLVGRRAESQPDDAEIHALERCGQSDASRAD